MSSSRALASSRAKRGGLTNEQPPNRPSNSSNQGSSNQNSSEIITIPSAITLITLRLGKLETYIQKLESEILPTLYNPTNTILPYNNNNLEEKINELTKKITNIELLKSKPVVSCSCSANDNTSEITKLKDLILFLQHKTLEDDKLQELTNEISKVKDLVLYLQNNSLEVNEKLINILFNSMSEEEEEEPVEEEAVEDAVVEGEKEDVVEEVVKEVVVEEQFVEKNE